MPTCPLIRFRMTSVFLGSRRVLQSRGVAESKELRLDSPVGRFREASKRRRRDLALPCHRGGTEGGTVITTPPRPRARVVDKLISAVVYGVYKPPRRPPPQQTTQQTTPRRPASVLGVLSFPRQHDETPAGECVATSTVSGVRAARRGAPQGYALGLDGATGWRPLGRQSPSETAHDPAGLGVVLGPAWSRARRGRAHYNVREAWGTLRSRYGRYGRVVRREFVRF